MGCPKLSGWSWSQEISQQKNCFPYDSIKIILLLFGSISMLFLHYHNDGEQIEDGANGPNGDAEVPTPSLLAFPQHIVFAGSTFAVFFVVLFFRN